MKFREFIVELREEVSSFERYWIDNHKKNPKDFPDELLVEGDWHEQFIAYIETKI